MYYVISYDISNDKRRNKIARILKDYGIRVQYSVFECKLTKKQFDKMMRRMVKVINIDEDRLRIYSLCTSCLESIKTFGVHEIPVWDQDFLIL